MKKMVMAVAVCVACLGARGESPARVVGTVATGGTSFAVPASGGMAFRLEANGAYLSSFRNKTQ
jgi:hypothetical protein